MAMFTVVAIGRWETVGSELFRLKSNTGAECCVGPVRLPQTLLLCHYVII